MVRIHQGAFPKPILLEGITRNNTYRDFACSKGSKRGFACGLRATLRAGPVVCVHLARSAVPRKGSVEPWEQRLRDAVNAQHPFGYSIRNMRGSIQVQRYWRDSGKRETATLPLEWHASSQRELLNALHAINSAINTGLSLKDAAKLAFDVSAGPTSSSRLNWGEVLRKFRAHKVDSGKVKERTWLKEYEPRLRWFIDQLNGPAGANNGTKALEAMRVGRNGQGDEPGSRGRKLRIQYAAQMLKFAVVELGIDERWMPPDAAKLAELVGEKRPNAPKAANAGQALELTDEQFLRLFDSIKNPSWKLAVGLLGVFGLRGVELNYATAKTDGLQVDYEKRMARGTTKKRLVPILDPQGRPGLGQQLLLTLQSAIVKLPPLGSSDSEASSAISTHLRRNAVWNELKAQARRASNDRVSVYSFRHGFVWRTAMAHIHPRVAAAACGHSLATHMAIYGQKFDYGNVKTAFAAASRQEEASTV